MRTVRISIAAALSAMLLTQAQPKAKLGDHSAGSRGQPAHIIPLRDADGDTIQPGDHHPVPFSTAQTCGGDCHDVAAISRGWHFNAATPGVAAGRNGQPWMLVDRQTATQLPLSYRTWPGTYRPQQLGINSHEFALRFGGRTAGSVMPDDADRARWGVSGALEVNCLICHDASQAYDQAEYARQVAQENFRLAPTAASGLAAVTGSSKDMPNLFDYLLPSVEDSLQPKIPHVEYASSRFLPSGKIAFDIVRDVNSSRCYYCHTNADVELTGDSRWKAHEDIHMARGITCVQCHRNGLDHNTLRGTESKADDSMSCEGCHTEGNSAGAPHPDHEGIPPIHFAKMTCTACHSGPLPGKDTRQLKNGMTHGLGEFNVNKSAQALPHIYYPVFARQADGKLAPNRMIWPAFWGRLHQGSVTPLHPDAVKKVLPPPAPLSADGSWPAVDDVLLVKTLTALGDDAVYIAGGKLHRVDGGKLVAEDHVQAQPYLWPIAHDVRPATQALGARGCEDCHSENAAVFFGNVAVDSPLASERTVSLQMNRFEKNLDIANQTRLAQSWKYRPWLKAIGVGASVLLLLFLLANGFPAVVAIQPARLRMVVAIGSALALLAASYTGFTALLSSSGEMTGSSLMWHVTFAPAFAIAAVVFTLFWAHSNRFAAGDPLLVTARKLFFWLAVALALPTLVSILAAMFPLFGTDDQLELFRVHRYSAPMLAGAAVVFAALAVVTRRERSSH